MQRYSKNNWLQNFRRMKFENETIDKRIDTKWNKREDFSFCLKNIWFYFMCADIVKVITTPTSIYMEDTT